jgi:RNA polymerase sigma-70 factor (ECF subfamily)
MDAEDALIVQAQANPERLGELYQRYLPRIYRYLRRLTASNEDASGLTQVVFIKAMAALPGYRPGRGPFPAWLFRIARNAATDAHRRRLPVVPLGAPSSRSTTSLRPRPSRGWPSKPRSCDAIVCGG